MIELWLIWIAIDNSTHLDARALAKEWILFIPQPQNYFGSLSYFYIFLSFAIEPWSPIYTPFILIQDIAELIHLVP